MLTGQKITANGKEILKYANIKVNINFVALYPSWGIAGVMNVMLMIGLRECNVQMEVLLDMVTTGLLLLRPNYLVFTLWYTRFSSILT